MKIGVISDTHINRSDRMLPNKVYEIFKSVDMILHAGDILIDEVIIELQAIAPTIVVAGNNDGYDIYNKYGTKRIIEAQGKKIGLTHGFGRGRAFLSAYSEFIEDDVDCIVYGHSHAPQNEVIDGILYFNPGSPTYRRFQAKHSVGILNIENGEITGEIIYFT